MSNNEAKFLLNAYRANGADAADPAFGPALAQAKSDPTLAAWFAREQAHAAAMSAKLRELAPPSDLREAILAGGRATAIAPRAAPRLGIGQWLGLAASLIVLVGAAFLYWPRHALSTEALAAFAFNDVRHGHHGAHSVAEKGLQTRLSRANTHFAAALPVSYDEMERTGCRTLTVGGREVVEICFGRNGAEFHCYLARAADFADRRDETGGPTFAKDGALVAANWAVGAYRCVIVTDAGAEALKRLL